MTSENLIMGVVNVTPDSFSDGGRFFDSEPAIKQALHLISNGADICDIGAESSRPGATAVSADEEWRRLEPVLEGLVARGVADRISVDTYKPEVMLKAAKLGVAIINDIAGSRYCTDHDLAALASLGTTFIAMHMHGDPTSMQSRPLGKEVVVEEVLGFFSMVKSRLVAAGFAPDKIWLDPGIGFGKDDGANLALLRWCLTAGRRWPLVVGVSRKSFMGRALGITDAEARDDASKMLECSVMCTGVKAVRTHEVIKLSRLRQLLH